MPAWLGSWVLIGLVIWPLIQVEKWIHKHVQGLGLLITNNPQAAILIYYVVFVPGVALHETSQWLLAKLTRVQVKKFRLWPEKQKGLIRLGLVEIEGDIDPIRTTLIGIIPLITGLLIIGWIVNSHFDTAALLAALATGDPPTMLAGIGAFMSAKDFWLWLYLVFAIANAMLPEPHDAINWWLILGTAAGITVFLLVLDLSILLQAALDGPLARMGEWVSLALVISLLLDLLVMGLIAGAEWLFGIVLNRELEYH